MLWLLLLLCSCNNQTNDKDMMQTLAKEPQVQVQAARNPLAFYSTTDAIASPRDAT